MQNLEINNITVRKPVRANSADDIFNINLKNNSTLLDTTMMSMPNTSLNDSDETESYKETIKRLTTELESAHVEIENLNTENFRLKMDIGEYQKIINTYKKVNWLDRKSLTPRSPCKKNVVRSSCSSTPTKLILQPTTLHQPDTVVIAQSPSDARDESFNTAGSICSLEGLQITQPQYPHKSTENVNSTDLQKDGQQTSEIITTQRVPPPSSTKSKICLLSTDSKNKVLAVARSVINHDYEICHYLKTNGDTKQLLYGLETKLCDFTLRDFCIILIGAEDFRITKDYFEIVFYVRKILQNITHTNVIICYPTYKLGYPLYNWRIESFNNLIYLDLISHQHAYFIDSNSDLTADFNMFYKHSGRVNNRGIKSIFENVILLMKDIDYNVELTPCNIHRDRYTKDQSTNKKYCLGSNPQCTPTNNSNDSQSTYRVKVDNKHKDFFRV